MDRTKRVRTDVADNLCRGGRYAIASRSGQARLMAACLPPAFEPGAKSDYVLSLEGGEGGGKLQPLSRCSREARRSSWTRPGYVQRLFRLNSTPGQGRK